MTAENPEITPEVSENAEPQVEEQSYYEHKSFLGFAKSELAPQLYEFLAHRDDLAGATAHQWLDLNDLAKTPSFAALKADERRQKIIETIGDEAYGAYFEYMQNKAKG